MRNIFLKIGLIYRKIAFYFSKKDMKAILKYDPLNILNNKNN
jgi:hypothetical protein